MRVRVFTHAPEVWQKYLNFLARDGTGLQAILCSPLQWLPPAAAAADTVADVHMYVGTPVRLAVPFARYNLFVGDASDARVVTGDMDAVVPASHLEGQSKQVLATLRSLFGAAARKLHDAALPVAPPKGSPPPKIAILTATAGRAIWWANMVRNVTEQAWPVSRMEWIIVDDEGDTNLADLVTEFRERTPGLTVRYKSVPPGTTIGAKRNIAARLAGGDVSVFAVMDDDDHYPANSLAARASWLLRAHRTDIVYCSTLPMYDIRKYVSAINVPPVTEPPTARISEATLMFTRAAWEERGFPEVSMAEGGGFVEGRLDRSVEIGPADVIVSFIHGGNTSSRRVPADQEPNGCHYGFSDDYFKYLHGLVESEDSTHDSQQPQTQTSE